MRNTSFSPFFSSFFFFSVLAACSVESTSPPSSGGEKPASTEPATEPAEPPAKSAPPPSKTSGEEEPQETKPKTPPKPFFEATLDGAPAVFDQTSITLDDDLYELEGVVEGETPYDSDSTLTVRFAKGESGAGICASGKRSVGLWYKDEDGAIRGIGTSFIYGNCTMTLDTSIPGYVSGQAQGTLGGAKQKSFTVKFAQKLP